MSEIPERIEREMFEIRNRMNPDVQDLKKHTEPAVIGKQVGNTIKEKVTAAAKNFGKSLAASAKRQLGLAKSAAEKRDPSALTDAVKSDPRPLVVLALVLTVMLLTARKLSGGRDDD